MTTHYGTFALALALGLALTGGTVQAQLLDAGASGTGSVNVGTDTVDSDTSVDADASTSADAGSDTGTNTSAGMDASVSGTMNGSSDDEGFSVMRRTLGDVSADASLGARASDVTDSAGLRAYAEASVRADDRFDGVVMDDGGMKMTYRKDARFLGFIPSGMNVTVEVANNGEVAVSYPWYSFLLATDESRADLEARLRAELASIAADASGSAAASASMGQESGDVMASGSASASATYDSQRWARVLERLQASLSADATAQAS